MTNDSKTWPFCAETIKKAAAYCRYCRFRGELLRYSKERDPRVLPEDVPPSTGTAFGHVVGRPSSGGSSS